MRVLIACEFSQIVCQAFRERGHEAFSCDLLPTEGNPAFHYQCSILTVLGLHWDLMIAHPPCTYLCNSGVRWLYGDKGTKIDPKRWEQMEEAAAFFKALLNAPIASIACENPIPHRYALEAIGTPYSQIIHPWQHSHPERKATCLWLKNLPPLKPSNVVSGRTPRVHHASPGPDRWKERSRTLPGIAKAMAQQYSDFLSKPQS